MSKDFSEMNVDEIKEEIENRKKEYPDKLINELVDEIKTQISTGIKRCIEYKQVMFFIKSKGYVFEQNYVISKIKDVAKFKGCSVIQNKKDIYIYINKEPNEKIIKKKILKEYWLSIGICLFLADFLAVLRYMVFIDDINFKYSMFYTGTTALSIWLIVIIINMNKFRYKRLVVEDDLYKIK